MDHDVSVPVTQPGDAAGQPRHTQQTVSRRGFLKTAGALAGAAVVPANVLGSPVRRALKSPVTLNYMVAGGSPFSEVVQKMLPTFTKQSGIKVNVIELPYENTYPKAIIEARNKTGAYDVIQMNRPTLAAFAEPKYLVPLEDYVSSSVIADLFPVHRNYVTFNGSVYAVPHSNDLRCLYYRTDLFHAAGYTRPPANWKEMEAMAKHLTRGARYGLILAGSPKGPGIWVLADFITQNGGSILDAHGQPALSQPAAVEALDFFVRLLNSDRVLPPGTPNYLWADTRTLFPEGKGAMVQEFNDIIPLLDSPQTSVIRGKYDLALIPGNVRKATNNAGWLVGIPVGTKYPKEAGKLIDFILSIPAQTAMCRVSGTLSPRKSVIDHLIAIGKPNRSKGDPTGKARWEFYREVIATTYELPRTPAEPQIETILGQALSSALTQQQSAQAAMATAQSQVKQLVG